MNLTAFFTELYTNFNKRDIDRVIAHMAEDVTWANGMDGGFVHGREGVRAYWTRQFTMVHSNVTPTRIRDLNGIAAIDVHQVVHDVKGNLLADEQVIHLFSLIGGKVFRFEIGSKPRIERYPKKLLVGQHQPMTFANHNTQQLWQSFIPKVKELKNRIGTDLFSLEIYPIGYFDSFNPQVLFEKWAAVEISEPPSTITGLDLLTIPAGDYAVFIHKGPVAEGPKTYQYIFEIWLPSSTYQIDDRPHFAVMGEKYKPNANESEEEIWIPIKPK